MVTREYNAEVGAYNACLGKLISCHCVVADSSCHVKDAHKWLRLQAKPFVPFRHIITLALHSKLKVKNFMGLIRLHIYRLG